MHDHVVGHVRARDRHTTGSPSIRELTSLWFTRSNEVGLYQIRSQVRWRGLIGGAVAHAQRVEDMVFHVLFEGLAGNALYDVGSETQSVVGICRRVTRGKDAIRAAP